MTFFLDQPAIYLITKGEATPATFRNAGRDILGVITAAVEATIPLIQIREKRITARQLFELTLEAARITGHSPTLLLINDRADIAVAAGADGVHLTANSLEPRIIRDSFPSDLVVGVSTHSLNDVRVAAEQGADFAVFGPVFETPGKGEPQGMAKLAGICDELRPFPVLGLGGIDESNYQEVLQAGAAGFAAIRLLNDPDNLRSIATRVLE